MLEPLGVDDALVAYEEEAEVSGAVTEDWMIEVGAGTAAFGAEETAGASAVNEGTFGMRGVPPAEEEVAAVRDEGAPSRGTGPPVPVPAAGPPKPKPANEATGIVVEEGCEPNPNTEPGASAGPDDAALLATGRGCERVGSACD